MKHKVIRRGVEVLAVAAVTLLLVEGLVRLLGLGPQVWPAPTMLENADKTFGLECYPEGPDSDFPIHLGEVATRRRIAAEGRFDPGDLDALAAEAPRCVPFRYNDRTYRDGPFEPVAEGRSVLVVGDSFAEGAGVVEEEVFVRRLEGLLASDEPLGAVRVWNGGRRGRDQPEIREHLDRLLPVLEPDLVIYAFVLNDFEQAPAYRQRQLFLNDLILDRQHMGQPTFRTPALLRWSELARLTAERWSAARASRATMRWYQGMTGPDNVEGWERTREDLRHMKGAVEARGGRFLVAVLPLLVGLEGDGGSYPFAGLHGDVAGACDELAIDHMDLLPALSGRGSRSLWVHPVDMHPNGTAHRLIAEALAPRARLALAE